MTKKNQKLLDDQEQDDYDSDSQFSSELSFQLPKRTKQLAEEFNFLEKDYSND